MSAFEEIKAPAVFAPPAKIEEWYASAGGGAFSSINAPTAGARFEQDLPRGSAPFQLYSLATPNGQKVGIILEELGIDYDAHVIDIMNGTQFSSGFVAINPNSKIPAALDLDGPGGQPLELFESGAILLYLADKYHRFIPENAADRARVMNWLFWQMSGLGPMPGNFGHFMVYAPDDQVDARKYGMVRYGMEVQRLCAVLDAHLKGRTYMVAEEFTIADMAIFPWFQQLRNGYPHKSGLKASDVLSIDAEHYPHAIAWADRIASRPAVQRGITVCSRSGAKPWLEQKKEEAEAK